MFFLFCFRTFKVGDYLSAEDTNHLEFINSSLALQRVVVTDGLYSLWDKVGKKGKVFC